MNATRRFLCVSAAAAISACTPSATTVNPPAKTDFLQANLDPTTNPGQDFFQYANGGWLKRNPIPNTESAWGIGNVVREQLYLNLRSINEQSAAAAATPGSDQQKIGDFWATAMDTVKTERLGI
ncbi:MAG TPA: M13 family metallopeptidase N-terminal domain-containing protein, partial [Gemmatimonadaceae bacterium]|nr:M13 family metallopeptidase N-terminal domain-containing protein [Gemmatimonadaceae bacterium]